jgi:hypothetical protein
LEESIIKPLIDYTAFSSKVERKINKILIFLIFLSLIFCEAVKNKTGKKERKRKRKKFIEKKQTKIVSRKKRKSLISLQFLQPTYWFVFFLLCKEKLFLFLFATIFFLFEF